LAWAVEPLAFSIFFPPQSTFTDSPLVVELASFAVLALLPFPHPDKISAPIVSTPSAAPNGLSFNSVPNGGDQTSLLVGAAAGQSAVFLAAMKLTAIRLTFG
jgi:hypothetical protein